MRQYCEFRINEEYADRLFAHNEGRRLGDSVRKIVIATDDPRFIEVKHLQDELDIRGESFYWGNYLKYKYSKIEIDTAELFRVFITAAFEPAGESCGTVYDDSETCPECGAGRTQISDLVLDLRKAPKKKDIARTISYDEWIVSQHLAELMVDANLTGFDLGPVRHKAQYQDDPVDFNAIPSGRALLQQAETLGLVPPEWEFYVWLNRPEQRSLSDRADAEHAELLARKARRRFKPPPVWYQLIVTSNPVPIRPPTRTGTDVFDDDPNDEYRCPYGHVIGLNLNSEVSVAREAWDGSDVVCTRELVGHRMGVLVPVPCLLISPRFYQLLRKEKIKGFQSEIAYLV